MLNKAELVSIVGAAVLGLVYVLVFVNKDPVLLMIFGLQALRGGLALRKLPPK